MDLSNLRPADGAKQSDNFRRGRGHGSGNGKTAGNSPQRSESFVPELQDRALKVVRCLYTEEFRREDLHAETLRKSSASTLARWKSLKTAQQYLLRL